MKLLALAAVIALSGCAGIPIADPFPAPYVASDDEMPAYYTPPPVPQYTPTTGLITQMGQPPAIISRGAGTTMITQQGQAPVIISGY